MYSGGYMFSYYFNIGLIYFIIGFIVALIYFFVFKKKSIGRFWGALIVALVGSFLGGIIEYIAQPVIDYLSNLNNAVNVFPPLITAIVLMWLFSKVSDKV